MINRKKPRIWGFSLLLVRLTGFEITDYFLNYLFLLPPSDAISVALAQNYGFQLFGRTSKSIFPVYFFAAAMRFFASSESSSSVRNFTARINASDRRLVAINSSDQSLLLMLLFFMFLSPLI